MELWKILMIYGGYAFALLMLFATLFFGWSHVLRAMLVFFAAVGMVFQYGCNRIVNGIGKATSGADIPENMLFQQKGLMTIFGVLMLLVLIVPNWRRRNLKK